MLRFVIAIRKQEWCCVVVVVVVVVVVWTQTRKRKIDTECWCICVSVGNIPSGDYYAENIYLCERYMYTVCVCVCED